MRHIAIIGSGPAGYYSAEAAQKTFGEDVRVDVFDLLPVPYGLIRSGVAPDHQSIKRVSIRYEKVALSENVRFVGNVAVGRDISVEKLRELYDAVIFATGAPKDRALSVSGAELPNVIGSAAFVGWYNGHPQHADLALDLSGETAIIIGMGNVALDVARILSKTRSEFSDSDIAAHALEALEKSQIKQIIILGRRGPHQIQMTPKELAELRALERAAPFVDEGDLPDQLLDEKLDTKHKKTLKLLRQFAENSPAEQSDKPISIEFGFFSQTSSISGDRTVQGIAIERTELIDGKACGTGEIRQLPADLVISCIGYQSVPIPGIPFDEDAGRFACDDGGRIEPGLYCVGWARRGPTGTIGTNRPDGYKVIEIINEDIAGNAIGPEGKQGRAGFDIYAEQNKLDIVTFQDWKKIEQAEHEAARDGSPREKFTDIEAMIAAKG